LPFRLHRILLAAMLAWPASLAPALAHEFKARTIIINHPWSRATPAVAPSAGGYFTVINTGTEPDRLVSIASPLAERVEIHESSIVDGVARMRPLPHGIEIAAGETVELQPGKIHLMFIRPSAPLVEGERFDATLFFEKAGDVDVEFAVQGMGTRPANSESHEDHRTHAQ